MSIPASITVPPSPSAAASHAANAATNGPITPSSAAATTVSSRSGHRPSIPALSEEEMRQLPALMAFVVREAGEQRCWWLPPGTATAPSASSSPRSDEATEREQLRKSGEANVRRDRWLFLQTMNVAFASVITSDLRLLMSEQRLKLLKDFTRLYKAVNADDTKSVWDEMKRCHKQRRNVHRRRTEAGEAAANEANRQTQKLIQAAKEEGKKLEQKQLAESEVIAREWRLTDDVSAAVAGMDVITKAASAAEDAEAAAGVASAVPTSAALRVILEQCDAWLQLLGENISVELPGIQPETAAEQLKELKKEAAAVRGRLAAWDDSGILLAIVGGENKGKSTFANSLTGMKLLLAANGRCSMVLTYVHFNVHSKRARDAGQTPAYEILLEYHSKVNAQAELHAWRIHELIPLAAPAASAERDAFNKQCDGFRDAIDSFKLPDGLQKYEAAATLDPIATVLKETGGEGKEHTMFLLKSVHVWVNVAESPFNGLPPLCVVDCPGYDSAMTLHRKLTEEAVAASDVIFYMHSVADTQDINGPARDSLRRLIAAADRALGEHLAAPERKEDGLPNAAGEDRVSTRDLENLFVICTYVQKNVIKQRHERLRQTLRERGIQRNGVWFADARLPSELQYAAKKAEQLVRQERQNDKATVDDEELNFDECTNEWLLMYSTFRAFAYTQLPTLLRRRLVLLVASMQSQMRQVKDGRTRRVQSIQSALQTLEQSIAQNAAEGRRLQQLLDDALSGATAALVWPTHEEQKEVELRYARKRSQADEQERLHTDGPGKVKYLGDLLAKVQQQWRELHENKRNDRDSCIEGARGALLEANGDDEQQVVASNSLLAELHQRVELEKQYGQLCENLITHLADEVRIFLDHHFYILIKEPYPDSSVVREHFKAVLMPTRNKLVESIVSSLQGVALFFSQIRVALLLHPLNDHYGERRLAVLELEALLRSRLSSANGKDAMPIQQFAASKPKQAQAGAIGYEDILKRLTALTNEKPYHLPLLTSVEEKELKADAATSEPDAAELQRVAERLETFIAKPNQDALKEQLRPLHPRFNIVIQDGFRELGRRGVAQAFADLLANAGVTEPQKLSETLRDLLFKVAQGNR